VAYSIEQLKDTVNRAGGIAKSNLFRIILPAQEQARNLDLLCRSTTMPSRSILTNDRTIGITKNTVAYGYDKSNVTMTFLVLNEPYVRYFFEEWMNLIVDNQTYQLGYYSDYTRNINIQQLKPTTDIETLATKITSGSDPTASTSGNKQDVNIPYKVIYNCLLEDAYPIAMSGPQLNDNPDQLVEISVDFVYKNWREVNSANSLSSDLSRNQQKNLITNSKPPDI